MGNEDKTRFIKTEFDCFVAIGMSAEMRRRVKKEVAGCIHEGNDVAQFPTLYLESREADGTLKEVICIELDANQVLRLLEFLNRFTVEDVRLIHSLMRR